MKNIILFCLISLFTSIQGNAQTTYNEILDTFFSFYEEGNTDQAIDYIFSTNAYLDGAQQQISGIKEKLRTVKSVIGTYYGYEQIEVREAGTHYVYVRCIVRHDRQPLFFTFLMYKPDKSWQLQTLRFDDKIEDAEMKQFQNILQK